MDELLFGSTKSSDMSRLFYSTYILLYITRTTYEQREPYGDRWMTEANMWLVSLSVLSSMHGTDYTTQMTTFDTQHTGNASQISPIGTYDQCYLINVQT
jgi:hypothetical protein